SRPSRSRVTRRPVSMAAIASDVEERAPVAVRPETAYSFSPDEQRPEWDPSQDENLFSSDIVNVPRTVVSRTPSQRFSSHGSIASNSSEDSPQLGDNRLSSNDQRHTRAVSAYTQRNPSPLPSPRLRPVSAGSGSDGSDY